MPKVTITVCPLCRKESCDGGVWVWVSITESGRPVNMASIPAENKGPRCTGDFGKQKKNLKDKKLGDEVVLFYPNWAPPAHLTVRKVEE